MISNIIDRTIEYIAPQWAEKRAVARYQAQMYRKFTGAQASKNRPGWSRIEEDADTAILADLPALRARCNHLVDNNEMVSGIVDEFVKNVVGTGITPQFSTKKATEVARARADVAEAKVKGIYAEPIFFDLAGRLDFYDMQGLALRHLLVDGEFFIRVCASNLYEIIDPARVWSERMTSDLNDEIRSGIEISRHTGKHVAYWIGPHPGAYRYSKYEFVRIPARDMLHGYIIKKAGQSRGYPIFSSALEKIHDLGEMASAALIAARIAACFALIIQKQQHGRPGVNDDGDNIDNIYPGMVKRLRPGENAFALDPKQPGAQFSSFMQYNQRGIAAGAGISYETVSRDASQGNFSSARLEKIRENATFRWFQNFMIKKLCRRVDQNTQEYLYLRGELSEIYPVRWQTPGFAWVDPEKDVAASILAIRNNIKDKSAIVAEAGGDIDEVYARRAIEIKREKELGINEDANEDKSTISDTGKTSAGNV